MRKLIWLLLLGGLCWAGYWYVTTNGDQVKEAIGEENINTVKERIAALRDGEGLPGSGRDDGTAERDTSGIVGLWRAVGPAVKLRTGNALGRIGGVAVAGVAEERLMPYYEQLQLDGTEIRFIDRNNFSLSIKGVTVYGLLTPAGDSGEEFSLKLFSDDFEVPEAYSGQKAYVECDGKKLALTVDVKKLVRLVSKVARNASDKATFDMAVKLTEAYDNVCLGFHFVR